MTIRAKGRRATRRIETHWRRGLGAGLLVVGSSSSCMIHYERVTEEEAFPAGSTVVATGTSTDAGFPGTDSELDAGVDAGPNDDSGTRDAAAIDCAPATYLADASCGVGYCRTTNQPSSCLRGVETACLPGAPLGPSDVTCDGVDDDCDGLSDEDHVSTATACGVGACAATGVLACQAGSEVDSCVPGAPLANDTVASGVGIDDDCDGVADEDEPCDTTPRTFTPGSYTSITVPLNCTQVSVRLWGGAGAGGELEGVLFQPGGLGGAGGHAESTLTLVSSQQLDLLVGAGAAASCNAAGSSALPGFGGGSGGTGIGADAEDGLQSGGGTGATPGSASRGGNGYRGGGGGGAGSPVIGLSGRGGGGGAASAFFVAGTPVVLAGGGGGGGGAASLILGLLGVAGGNGGVGCGGSGATADANGGGGGGGGACLGTLTRAGTNAVPFDAASLPANQARGGQSSCFAGGGGYAIVTFAP